VCEADTTAEGLTDRPQRRLESEPEVLFSEGYATLCRGVSGTRLHVVTRCPGPATGEVLPGAAGVTSQRVQERQAQMKLIAGQLSSAPDWSTVVPSR